VLMVTSWRHGKWTKPAGSLEQGETPEQGVSREFWEEVGHKVTFKREHYLFSNCTRNILSHFYAYVTSDLAEFKRIADAKPPTHADETFGTVSIPIFYETSPIPRGWPVYLRENGSFEENGERTMRRELLLMLYRCKVVTWNVLNAWCKTAGMPVMSMQLKQQIEG
jgi:ADP-ribose pyrophosphatase YjhB (NUDIX family)